MDIDINSGLIEPCFNTILEAAIPESDLYFELQLLERRSGSMAAKYRGKKIVDCFPYPISKELGHLFSSSYNVRDQNRLLKIFRVAERISQFLSFCWLVQLWDAKSLDHSLELTPDFQAQFSNFNKPTIGTYLGIIRSSSNILFKAKAPIFFRESDIEVRTKQLILEIGKLTESRNKEIHFKEETNCEDVEGILSNIMVNAAFLIKYPMVSVKMIEVSKPKLSTVKYRHEFDINTSADPTYMDHNIQLENFSESSSVLLIENLQTMGTFLNLSPFVINTNLLLDSRGNSKVLHGLYMYAEKEHDMLRYAFVNETDMQQLRDMPEHEVFERQWNNLFEMLSP